MKAKATPAFRLKALERIKAYRLKHNCNMKVACEALGYHYRRAVKWTAIEKARGSAKAIVRAVTWYRAGKSFEEAAKIAGVKVNLIVAAVKALGRKFDDIRPSKP